MLADVPEFPHAFALQASERAGENSAAQHNGSREGRTLRRFGRERVEDESAASS
jgi:hypothetical protein